ncbi:NAD(P)/FAD-dependent oxidoreductase [Streptomyces sp. NPDC101181]|uniref:NAD(P)/FAD-dependent oxidoreductase n=1 Tax=Streptomyces sp. NPDC101181 TaxID=3366125 RepID=UPI00382A242D
MQRNRQRQHRVIVIGAGYSGATAAGRLARRVRREDVAITVVNAEPDFAERVRMHQLAAGQELKARPLRRMFAGTGVAVKVGRVTELDVIGRTVTLTAVGGAPETLEYDTLVYALGSGWDTHGVPGVAEHAHDVSGRPGALRLRARLAALGPGEPVVVVGGGLTGLETATEIAEARPDLAVTLATRGTLGDWLSAKGARHLRGVMAGLGITVHETTAVTAVAADRITTTEGDIASAATVWTTGFATHPLATASALRTTATGQIPVDATLRTLSHPDVYAIGDAALASGPGGTPLRMSCASGVPSAWQAADAIAARLTGTKLPNIPIRYVNQCVSLGRKDGLIQYVTADDRSRDTALTGRLAALYKELVCKGAAWGVAHPTLALPTRRRRATPPPTRTPPPTDPAKAT